VLQAETGCHKEDSMIISANRNRIVQ